ncbi:unnamed protein product [Pleuronectes platessa]|uniref:Uncharacterized protein n=1 Tax=Pleuronectes platessa TaxID=8262 RepID=A0A9N7U1Q6_PLEPL|nr:unnamed protein product [Pleuronectes platessa]
MAQWETMVSRLKDNPPVPRHIEPSLHSFVSCAPPFTPHLLFLPSFSAWAQSQSLVLSAVSSSFFHSFNSIRPGGLLTPLERFTPHSWRHSSLLLLLPLY